MESRGHFPSWHMWSRVPPMQALSHFMQWTLHVITAWLRLELKEQSCHTYAVPPGPSLSPHALPCAPSFPELFKCPFLSFDEGLEALVAETEGVLRRQHACQWDTMGSRMPPVQPEPDAQSL